MTTIKTSTLPAVLKEYLPEYEPRSSTVKTKTTDEAPAQSGAPQEDEVKGQEQNDTPVTPRSPGEEADQGHHGGRRSSRAGAAGRRASRAVGVDTIEEGKEDEKPQPRKSTALQRERTMEMLKKQERERYTRNFENWQQVKTDEREDKTRHYRSKIALQQELIRHQDERFLRRRRQEEEEKIKQQEAAREARHAQEQALLEVCRQSLEQDRKRVAKRSSSRRAKKSAKDTSKGWETDTKDEESEIKPLTVRQVTMMSEMSSHSSLASGAFNMGIGSPKGGTLEEANEDGEEGEDEDELGEMEELPWHHQQLYRLYGNEADYFLHPKIEVQKTPRQISQRSRARPVYNGRTGARKLWNNLRTESRMRLLAEDSNISQELKSAYSAFFRQALQRHKKPVKRNYYAEEDVPDADRLLDQSIIHNTQDLRHKMELMYRSSQINEDRAKVLLFNNPPPNLNNIQGEESVIRYMPSWVDDRPEISPQPSYKKWLQVQPFPAIAKQSAQVAEGEGAWTEELAAGTAPGSPEVEDKENQEDWDFMLVKKPLKVRKPKYQFLTEEAATCEGQFSRRRREMAEAKNLPEAYSKDLLPTKPQSGTQSAMAMMSRGPALRRSSSVGTEDRQVSGLRSQSEATHRYISPWEPLSLNALVEYKHHVKALGEGKFAHGTTHMWSVMTP